MTSDAYDGLPDWMTVGAQVLQVLNRRYYGAIVTSGRVHRVLARDVVVIDDEGVALTRFRRTDYEANRDLFRRRATNYHYADYVYLYRADDPRAIALQRQSAIMDGLGRLVGAVGKLPSDFGSLTADTPCALDAIAAAAAKLAGLIRESE